MGGTCLAFLQRNAEDETRYLKTHTYLMTSWRDKVQVHIVSIVHEPIKEQSRCDLMTKEYKWKPQAAIAYNVNIHLVDKSDSMINVA